MSAEDLKNEFVPKYQKVGDKKFYQFLLTYALNKLIAIEDKSYKGVYPDLEYLGYYEQFMILYRREGEDIYIDLARIFRRAGHRIYRIMLKKKIIKKNLKFLNLVSK